MESPRFRLKPLRRDSGDVGDFERLPSLEKDDDDPRLRDKDVVDRLHDIPSRLCCLPAEKERMEAMVAESPRLPLEPLRRDGCVVGDDERLGSFVKDDEDPRRCDNDAIDRSHGIPSRLCRRSAEKERIEAMVVESPRLPLKPLRRDGCIVGDVEQLRGWDEEDEVPCRREKDAEDRSHDIPSRLCCRSAEKDRMEAMLAESPRLPLKPLRRDGCIVGDVERLRGWEKEDEEVPCRCEKDAEDRSHDIPSRLCCRSAEKDRMEAMLAESPRLPLKPLRRDGCIVGDVERLRGWEKEDDEVPCRREKDAVDRSHGMPSRGRPAETDQLEVLLAESPCLPLKPDPSIVGDVEHVRSWDKEDDEGPCRREKDAVDLSHDILSLCCPDETDQLEVLLAESPTFLFRRPVPRVMDRRLVPSLNLRVVKSSESRERFMFLLKLVRCIPMEW